MMRRLATPHEPASPQRDRPMLRGLRNASANWLGRAVMGAVMGLLALSFAIWGINDIFRGFGRSTVAKIGDTEIPIETFRRIYDERLQQITRQLGRPLTPEQANGLGLDRQVLSQMIAETALNQRARQMRLGVSDAEIAWRITADPTFAGPNGQFDRARFEQILRNAGYSEQRFVAEQRHETLRRQIAGSVSGDMLVPKAWLEALNQFQNQERSIEYVTLGPAQAGEIMSPGADELNRYFTAHRLLFRAPEYRKIVIVQVTPAALAKWMEVADTDIRRVFDEHSARYVTPERRHVEQIVFPGMQEAQAAKMRLQDGLSFAALAAERGLKEQDIDLGSVAKSDLVDPAVAEAAFSLKEGEVSEPVSGRFGAVILTVLKIEPKQAKPFGEVAQQIRDELGTERAKVEVQSLHDKIEDARAGGSTLDEAAQKLKLPAATYDLDRSGRDANGKLAANFPHAGDVVSAAFASDVGVDNDPIEADGGYIWYSVVGITPARERTLEEVKDQVEESWRQDEIASRLKAKAADLLEKLKSGNSLEALAKADDLKVETAAKLTRGKASTGISTKTIEAIFHTSKDAFGSAAGDKVNEWVVFRVSDVTTPGVVAGSEEAKRMDEVVQRQLSNDVLGEYITRLEDDLGTSINRAALAQALGTSAPDTN